MIATHYSSSGCFPLNEFVDLRKVSCKVVGVSDKTFSFSQGQCLESISVRYDHSHAV